ncbi:MAG: hypothetical protein AAF598_19615, partial [Bacteroidota bacterium]
MGKQTLPTFFKSPLLWGVIVVLGSFTSLYLVHGDVLIHPNRYQLADSGEAVRSNFLLAYHLKYDSAAFHFEGMNYPYGEHVVFCDAQPLISTVLFGFSRIFPG